VDLDDIHAQTGISKGADGQWRQEIDDSKSKIKLTGFDPSPVAKKVDGKYVGTYAPKEGATPLQEAFHHPELYEAYPDQLKDVTVNSMPREMKDKGWLGAQAGNKIWLADDLTSDEYRTVLLHEIQHRVQDIEGFAKGDNPQRGLPEGWGDVKDQFQKVKTAAEKQTADDLKANPADLNIMKQVIRNELYGTDITWQNKAHIAAAQRILANNPDVKNRLATIVKSEKQIDNTEADAYSAYNRAMGEVESRNVEKRRNLTAQKRREYRPEETEDVPRFLQRNAAGHAAGGAVGYADGGGLSFDDLVPPAGGAPPPAAGGLSFDDLVPASPSSDAPSAPTSSFDYVNPTISKAVSNIPGSAAQFGKNLVQPFLHPIDTAESIKNLGMGVLEKTGILSGKDHEKYADAVGQFVKDRYGSLDKARKTLEEDPVGMAGDVSMLFTGGGSMAARLPGMAGRIGEVARTVGSTIDPLNAVTPVARAAGNLAGRTASETLGVTTGVGSQPIDIAARAGYEGGQAGEAFRDSVTGRANMADVVDQARDAVAQLRQERGTAYRRGMAGVGADRTVLDFNEIDRGIDRASDVQTYSGQSGVMPTQDLSPRTADIRGQMMDAVDNWRSLYPPEFHTPEGFDALKRQLGNIRDDTQPNTSQRVAADRIYGAVRQTIIDQAPQYARVMQGYEHASDLISNIERELSLNPKANVDTSLRKLQSVLRDNVNTSFGRRADLANYLVNAGAPNLLEHLAGQALHSWAPRGVARGVLAGATLPEIGGAVASGHPGVAAAALATLPATSPRLVGSAAYGAGAAARYARPVARAAARTTRPGRAFSQATTPYQGPDLGPLQGNNPYAP
jgi:hypothetical protein